AVRGGLRETFDEMRSPAVFVLTNADALLGAPAPSGDADDPDARSPAEQLGLYLFDRIEAFDGITALALRRLPAPFEDRREGAVGVRAWGPPAGAPQLRGGSLWASSRSASRM